MMVTAFLSKTFVQAVQSPSFILPRVAGEERDGGQCKI